MIDLYSGYMNIMTWSSNIDDMVDEHWTANHVIVPLLPVNITVEEASHDNDAQVTLASSDDQSEAKYVYQLNGRNAS